MKNAIVILILFVSFISCKKEAGEGGTASITGSVWVKNYNSTFTLLEGEYAALEEDVYIVYGDHNYFDERTRTNYNGVFRFGNLRKGKYTVYVYSKDSTFTEPSGKLIQKAEVEVTKNGQELTLDEFIIIK